MAEASVPEKARAVIIGGGVIGCSLAYHLAHLGWRDIVLLERRQLTCGTTWHAAGLIAQLRATQNMTRLARYSQELYGALEAETGLSTGFRRNGSVTVALGAERLEELRRQASMARSFGVEVEEIGIDEVKARLPQLSDEGVTGGVYLPKDGHGDPANIAQALARGARQLGARILEGVKVTGIDVRDGRVRGVSWERDGEAGTIESETVANCAGMWAREVGRMAGTAVPLQACEHFYVVTDAIPGLPRDMPVLRVPDECAYYKEDAGKLLVGFFEPVARPWALGGIPEDFSFDQLPPDLDHLSPMLEMAVERFPALGEVGIHTFFDGPESFTPDDRYLLGETPEVAGLYVAAGFNSVGIQSAGGAGKALAEWMEAGEPPFDLSDVDIRRMQPFQNTRAYLAARVSETLGLLYADHFPYRQFETARGIRRSPLHDRLEKLGACFGETAGWERANWFLPEEARRAGETAEYRYSWGRQNWFAHSAGEHLAVREAVGLFDMSSFAKYRVEGPDAEDVLQKICAGDVAVEPGRIVYTQWLNARGGIEADVTVTRLSETAFIVVSGAAMAGRDMAWLRRNIPQEARCVATDVTSAEACITVMGPQARDLLAPVLDTDLSNEAFPFGTMRETAIGMALGRAHRVSYVGELGWELYLPSEMARHAFEAILAAGEGSGLRLCGMHALDSCRMEKAFRHFGHDITDEDHVLEAGLGFAVKAGKPEGRYGPFIGRDAVLAKKEAGLSKRLLQFRLKDPGPLLFHTEPVWRDGRLAGYLTSGNYGHHLGAAIGLGYVACDPAEKAADVLASTYEIEVAGLRVPAEASLKPLYDPKSERMRA
ncbi:FAD-dependent oxidoreductase [Afifella sp. IM 167]|uniref:GcvT family protein n=1 Tax=Afifella sp. IM 167 TaxID=2033586 RepID=UPI001CCDD9FC|nr:FAD-dependent oxidoreductase [Afifella sp. IM 167]MBZ8135172.1 FAD-dependent oxidoreductase [Afifella sp. IM 167]